MNEEASDQAFWVAMSLERQGRFAEAMASLRVALEENPYNVQAFIAVGELYLFKSRELGVDSDDCADKAALESFEAAIRVEPENADAWSRKALAELYLGDAATALGSAEQGLAVLPLLVGYAMQSEDKFRNVAEALFDVKVRALIDLSRHHEAYTTLRRALEQFPASSYLMRHSCLFEL